MNWKAMTRRRFLKWSGGALGLGVGVGLYGWRVEPHWVEVVERELPVRGLPAGLVGSRMVQLSDLHIGPGVDDDYLSRCFERVKEMAPDLVVYTGDFVTRGAFGVDRWQRMLAQLPQGRRGTFGVLGNHDYGSGWKRSELAQQICDWAGGAGVRMLRNEQVEVDGLQVVGLDELWSPWFDLVGGMKGVDVERPGIVLAHNPDMADLPGWKGYTGWILCGHTHGGQCRPPFLPPPLLPVKN